MVILTPSVTLETLQEECVMYINCKSSKVTCGSRESKGSQNDVLLSNLGFEV